MDGRDLAASVIVEQMRSRVDASSGAHWAPSTSDLGELAPMTVDPNLAYLHRHWALGHTVEPPSVRASRGRPRAMLSALVRKAVLGSLRPYLGEEQELVARMVRVQDALAKRCDALHEEHVEALDSLRADLMDLLDRMEAALGGAGSRTSDRR